MLVATSALTGCLGSGSKGSQNATATPRTTVAPSLTARQAATLATDACKEYDVAVDADNAHPDPAITYPRYLIAIGEADTAFQVDPQWQNLAHVFDNIKADITQITSLSGQATQSTVKNGPNAALNQDVGFLKGQLIAVDVLCTPLTGSSHLPA
jgi:hypothetical protein